MKVTVCDWKDGKSNCEERGIALVTYTISSQRMEIDLCEKHLQTINQNARPAETTSQYTRTTQLPRAEPRKKQEQLITDPLEMKECRRWLESQGDLPENSRGRIAQKLQAKYIENGSPVEVADGSFKKSA